MHLKRSAGSSGACDDCERSADQIAGRALATSTPSLLAPPSTPSPPAGQDLAGTGGAPLDSGLRRDLEARFDHDFSRVRVHTGAHADRAARSVDADAFTMGSRVAFRSGEFRPETPGGIRLLAHELAHVVQTDRGIGRGVVLRNHHEGTPAPAENPAQGPAQDTAQPESVEVDGVKLTMSASQIRSALWPIFESQSARGLEDFERKVENSIRADGGEIENLRQQAESARKQAAEFEKYGPGDVSGTPWTPEMYEDIDRQIRKVEERIALKQRIQPVLRAQIARIVKEPNVTQADLDRIERLSKAAGLNQALARYRDRLRLLNTATALRSSARDRGGAEDAIGVHEDRVREAKEALDREVTAAGYADLDAYTTDVAGFESFFERYALQTAFSMLDDNRKLVEAELSRYGGEIASNTDVNTLWRELRPIATFTERERDFTRQSVNAQMGPGAASGVGELRRGNQSIEYAAKAADEKRKAEEKRKQLAPAFPVLADSSINLYEISHASAADLAKMLSGTATDRLSKIEDAWRQLVDDPSSVWEAEGAIARAKQSLGVAPGSVHDSIIAEKLQGIANRKLIRDLFLAALAIGLGLVSMGAGTVAVIGAVGAAAVSGITVGLHVQEFLQKRAFSGTAFDRAQALSANEPSLFWLAVDIAGAIVDVGAAVSAFRSLSTAARQAARLAGETEEAARLAQQTLKTQGNAVKPGLGDKVAQSAARARSDAGVLRETAESAADLTHVQIQREFEIAQRAGQRRPLIGEGYVEEIVLPNGHTWRRSPEGRWCRFSDLGRCFLFLGESPETRSMREVGRSTAGVKGSARDRASTILGEAMGPAPFPKAQAHHVVPMELQQHPLVATMQRDFSWQINGSRNGIWLPSEGAVAEAASLPLHRGAHPVYTSMVEARCDQLWYSYRAGKVPEHQLLDEFEKIVDEFRGRLASNKLLLKPPKPVSPAVP